MLTIILATMTGLAGIGAGYAWGLIDGTQPLERDELDEWADAIRDIRRLPEYHETTNA